MQIAPHTVVAIDYKLTDPQGNVLDTSEGRDPLHYLHGVGQLIPGLERELDGRSTGDVLDVTVDPKEAYGERDEQLVQSVERAQFAQVEPIETGQQFQVRTPEGAQLLTIVEVGDDQVTVDGNHPLAGVTLHFHVEVKEVRAASQEELDHGHVHGPGGHDH